MQITDAIGLLLAVCALVVESGQKAAGIPAAASEALHLGIELID